MPSIPNQINGVVINFAPNVNNSVDQKIIDALSNSVKNTLVKNHNLSSIYISSANDQHKLPSRHVQGLGKAIDISRVNGKKMSVFYQSDLAVKSIVDALQNSLESYKFKRENFGPSFKKKNGVLFPIAGHNDHIHFSVN